MTRLQVWGDPIAHSKSPALHAAAYAALGLDWTYDRRQVSADEFGACLASLDDSYRGLSLTMPLKEEAFRAAVHRDERAERTGAVNTLLLTADGPLGFNTDIGGFLGALRENGVTTVTTARIVGAGSTAASALVALAEAGADGVEVVARSPHKAAPLRERGSELGVPVTITSLDALHELENVDATIATLPGATHLDHEIARRLAETGGTLLDAVYAPWPTQLADAFAAEGHSAASGRHMLLHQAVLQVRIFVNNDPHTELVDERVVVAAMRSALMGD